jgi:Tetratricopeptide repeat
MGIVDRSFAKHSFLMVALVCLMEAAQGCAPRPPYRPPLPGPSRSPAPPVPPSPPAPPSVREPPREPLPQESKIREQDLKPTSPLPPPAKETPAEPSVTPEPVVPPLAEDSSLLAKITPGTAPQRAASLRLTEEGRKLLDAGEAAKALTRLERTIAIDSTNPYGYFYLAKAHYHLGRYRESLSFLDVAESRFSDELFWLSEVHALRGENFRALGMVDKAAASYAQALRLNSGNRTANDALLRLQVPSPQSYSR